MHFVVAWDIKSMESRRKVINDAMKEGLRGYSWVRPLTSFYIVRVNSQESWISIKESLASTAQKFPSEVYFVMTPLMEGGGYRGWLPKDLWPKIRKRTEEEEPSE